MIKYDVSATDGTVGRCKDFLFDEETWTLRYIVVDTGKWLPGRKVLISPISVGDIDASSRTLSVKLSWRQIEDSPPLDDDAPVSRRYEQKWLRYYGWPNYWYGDSLWGPTDYPVELYLERKQDLQDEMEEPEETHLRSVWEVTGYHIHAVDGDIGHVEDFLVDDHTWNVRYMIVDTRNWLPGRKVLVRPDWIESIVWAENKVHVNVTSEAIRNSPKYDPDQPLDADYEARLHDHYSQSE
jgi:hypothetical protein